MRRWGLVFVAIAVGSYFLSAASAWERGTPKGFVAALFNPLVFVCLPLAVYWLFRGGVVDLSAARTDSSTWRTRWGILAMILGTLGFWASATRSRGRFEDAVIDGLSNPVFFVGVPLGLLWLMQQGVVRFTSRPQPQVVDAESISIANEMAARLNAGEPRTPHESAGGSVEIVTVQSVRRQDRSEALTAAVLLVLVTALLIFLVSAIAP